MEGRIYSEIRGRTGDFVYVSAQNLTDLGSVEVYIYVNGSVFKKAMCEGAYCIATASGNL